MLCSQFMCDLLTSVAVCQCDRLIFTINHTMKWRKLYCQSYSPTYTQFTLPLLPKCCVYRAFPAMYSICLPVWLQLQIIYCCILGIIMIVSYLYWGISCTCFHMMNTNHSCMAHLCFSDCFRVTSRVWLCILLCPCHINLVLRLWLYDDTDCTCMYEMKCQVRSTICSIKKWKMVYQPAIFVKDYLDMWIVYGVHNHQMVTFHASTVNLC